MIRASLAPDNPACSPGAAVPLQAGGGPNIVFLYIFTIFSRRCGYNHGQFGHLSDS